MSQRKPAAETGLGPSFVAAIENGRKETSRNFLQILFATYRVNPTWILEGQGAPILDPEPDRSMLGVPMADFVQVRCWRLGDDAPLVTVGEYAFLSAWLRERTCSPGACWLLHVPDDRMAPAIPAGAVVMLDQQQKLPVDNALFVLRLDGGLHVRRLRQVGRQWQIECDNRAHPDRPVLDRTGRDSIMGRVLWQGSSPAARTP